MSVERYFKEVIKSDEETSGTSIGYGTQCKRVVQALLETAGDVLTIAKTDKDTTSEYAVWLQIYDTNVYLKIYNSSGMFVIQWYWGLDSSYRSEKHVSNYFNGKAGLSYRATMSRLGDFACSCMLGCSNTNTGLTWSFSKFTSDYNGQEYYRIYVYDASVGLTNYGNIPSPFVNGSTILASDGTSAGCSAIYFSQSASTITKATKTSYILMPYMTTLYNDSSPRWLGHVKWGGKYDIYVLQDSNGNHTVVPNANYIVDGVTYKGAFNCLFIPVECS